MVLNLIGNRPDSLIEKNLLKEPLYFIMFSCNTKLDHFCNLILGIVNYFCPRKKNVTDLLETPDWHMLKLWNSAENSNFVVVSKWVRRQLIHWNSFLFNKKLSRVFTFFLKLLQCYCYVNNFQVFFIKQNTLGGRKIKRMQILFARLSNPSVSKVHHIWITVQCIISY